MSEYRTRMMRMARGQEPFDPSFWRSLSPREAREFAAEENRKSRDPKPTLSSRAKEQLTQDVVDKLTPIGSRLQRLHGPKTFGGFTRPQPKPSALPAVRRGSPASPAAARSPRIDLAAIYRDMNQPGIRAAVEEVLEVEARTGVAVMARVGAVAVRNHSGRSSSAKSFSAMANEYYGASDVDGLIETSLRGGAR